MCADWYEEDYYLNSPAFDPEGPRTGRDRVDRGGAWVANPMGCRRGAAGPFTTFRQTNLGFRVACNVAPPNEPADSATSKATDSGFRAAQVRVENAAAAAPTAKKADYDAIATGKWIAVLPGGTDLRDGTVVIPKQTAGDVIVRARVKKISGQNLGIGLRRNEERPPKRGGYSAWFNGGNWFGIFKGGEGRKDLRQWHTPTNFDDYFEFAFSAVGETLTVYVDGKRTGEARDADYRLGSLSIQALRGRSLFQNVEIMILDKSAPSTDKRLVPLFDADRRAAEWAIALGGTVRVGDMRQETDVTTVESLPSKFELVGIDIRGKQVGDAGMANLKGLTSLRRLLLWSSASKRRWLGTRRGSDQPR